MKELLKLIPVSRFTIYRWVKEGKFPASVTMGGCTMWQLEKVEKFLVAEGVIDASSVMHSIYEMEGFTD